LKAIARQGIVLYRGLDGKLLGTIPTPQAVTAIVFSSDSSKAYVGELNSIVVYDAVKFKTLLTIADATTPTALAVSPDGTTVYAADGSTIQSFNTATGALLNTFAIPATELAISPDGSTLWAAQFSSTTLNLLNTQTSVVTPVTLPYVATALVVVSGSD
jgi:DNA-binding beta-propeller fold protein YncE